MITVPNKMKRAEKISDNTGIISRLEKTQLAVTTIFFLF